MNMKFFFKPLLALLFVVSSDSGGIALDIDITYEPETLSTPKFHKHIASSSYVKTVIS
jgi:hypothetical protein